MKCVFNFHFYDKSYKIISKDQFYINHSLCDFLYPNLVLALKYITPALCMSRILISTSFRFCPSAQAFVIDRH